MRILILMYFLSILFLTGCACMDLSMTDTAIPLKAKQMQFSSYSTLGWDPFTVIGETPDTVGYGHVDGYDSPVGSILLGLQGSIGLGRDLELGAKYCNYSGGFYQNHTTFFNYKTYLKYRFYHPSDRISFTLEPTYAKQANWGSVPVRIGYLSDISYKAVEYEFSTSSLEFPLLITKEKQGKISFRQTLVLRPSYDIISLTYSIHPTNKYHQDRYIKNAGVWRVGIFYELNIAGKKNPSGAFLSLGCEIGGLDKSKKSFMPVISYGYRIATNDHKK